MKLSKVGREYYEAASWYILAQGVKPANPIDHKVSLNIFVHPPDRRVRDLDNLMKVTCDVLWKCGIIKNDSVKVVRQIHAYCCTRVTDGLVVVEIHDCTEEALHGQHTG
jgi:Holliday junction resolvase RusA-like endonuclease